MKNLTMIYEEVTEYSYFEEMENRISNYIELKSNAVGKSFLDNWNERHFFIQAGIPHKTIALFYNLSFENNEINEKDLYRTIANFFEEEFREDNVLSLRIKKEAELYHFQILIYPLDGRILNIDKWIKHNKIKNEFIQYFYQKIEECFQIKIECINQNQYEVSGNSSMAEIDIIKELELPAFENYDNQELIYDARGYSGQIQTSMAYEKLEDIINSTLKYFTVGNERMLFKQAQTGQISREQFLEQVSQYLIRNYTLDDVDRQVIAEKIDSAVFGNYILDDLLNDESISDIKVLGPNKIRVKVNGKRMTSNLSFIDTADYFRFINSLAIRNNLDLSDNAIISFTDNITNPKCIMRFNISTPYVNSVPYPYLHIRKIRKDKYSINDLIRLQVMNKNIADYLVYKARNGKGIIFTGKGASGKTTVMNTLLDNIPYTSSGLVIQESDELFTNNHPDFMIQHVVNIGGIQYSLQDEARNGLLIDLDYFIIGEIKGAEALYFLNAADTGHKCWCSVHSPSSVDAINKLADYVMYESKYNKEDALYMLKELDTIVYMKNFKVDEISEVVGWDNNSKNLVYKTVYKR